MPDTPTTEGSIVAFLRVDDSDWNEKLDRAEEKARALGRIDPTIRVHADTADALAKIEAVRMAAEENGVSNLTTTVTTVRDVQEHTSHTTTDRASSDGNANAVADAEARMQAAMDRARMAAQAEEVAAMRLDDVQNRRRHTDTQVASAELALERAMARTAAAQDAAIKSGQALRDARAALADADNIAAQAASDLESAVGGAGKSTSNAGASAQRSGGYLAVMAGVIAALVPVAADLSGYIAGVGGAFLGMGSAGVLAVLGIKNEMAAGTAQGQQYTSLMNTVKDDLAGLETVAASGVLTPFASMIDRIDGSMPQLSSEIGGFSRDLGTIGVTVVSTLVSGFETLNPLFQEGAGYLQHLATEWQQWTTNGGLQQFASFAEQALPLVGDDLGKLATLAMHLLDAFAPFGTMVLTVLRDLLNVMDAIPINWLEALIAGAAVGAGIFATWKFIAPMLSGIAAKLGAVAVAEDIANASAGAMGIVFGTLAAITATVMISTQNNTQAVSDYTAALEQSNGVINGNIRALAAKNLQDLGVLDTARKYGISLSDVTSAALGNVDAQNRVNAALRALPSDAAAVGAGHITSKIQDLSDAINGQSQAFNTSMQSYRNIAAASATTTQSQDMLLTATNHVSQALAAQQAQATFLNNAYSLLNGGTIDLVGAQDAAASAVNTATSTLKTNHGAITGNTQAAIDDREAIKSAAQAAQQHSAAVMTSTGSLKDSVNALETDKVSLEKALKATGNLTAGTQSLIDKLYAIPPDVVIQIQEQGWQAAIDHADAVARHMRMLDGTNAVLNVTTYDKTYGVGVFGAAPGHAFGGTIGGTVAGSGTNMSDSILTRLSRGEEVISNARGQASQFRGVLKAINAGASVPQVQAMVGAPAEARTVNHFHQTFQITTNNPEQFFQLFQSEINRLAVV